jgi:hypothetical protein
MSFGPKGQKIHAFSVVKKNEILIESSSHLDIGTVESISSSFSEHLRPSAE